MHPDACEGTKRLPPPIGGWRSISEGHPGGSEDSGRPGHGGGLSWHVAGPAGACCPFLSPATRWKEWPLSGGHAEIWSGSE